MLPLILVLLACDPWEWDTAWERVYDIPGFALDIAPTGDGGAIIAGSALTSGNGNDVLVLRVDSFGDLLWHRHFGGPSTDWASSVSLLPDGGAYVAATRDDHPWLLRLNAQGDTVWTRLFQDSVGTCGGHAQTYDNGCVLTGCWEGRTRSLFLLRYDENGSLQWQRTWSSPYGWANGYDIVETHDHGFLISDFPGRLVRVSQAGDLLWERHCASGELYALASTRTGAFVGAGSTWYGSDDERFLVAQFDTAGTRIWSRETRLQNVQYATDVFSCQDGGCIAAGTVGDPRDGGSSRVLLLKYSATGRMLWTHTIGSDSSVGRSVAALDGGWLLVGGADLSTGEARVLLARTRP